MANVVPIASFVFKNLTTGKDVFYRQDTAIADTDPAYVAVPQMFIAAGGAKTASSSFCYRDAATGKDRFCRKGKTKVSISHPAYVVAPGLFT